MLQTFLTLGVIAAAILLTARRVDVRLALGLSAIPLFLIAGDLPAFFGTFAREMANPATIVPICSAMGFSYVLRATECDLHLVRLLLRPLRTIRALLVPGGIAAGYLVNTTLVSQTSAAAVLGPILIPLLRAGGVPPATAGAVLLLGCSMGGELFNPGAVEVATLASLTGRDPENLIFPHIARWNLLASAVALLLFWLLEARRQARAGRVPLPEPPDEPIHWLKALVPVLPIALRFALPNLIPISREQFPGLAEPVSILGAMLIGCAAAALTTPRRLGRLGEAFFDGAGYGYIRVISLIVTATVFTEGIKATGLIARAISFLSGAPALTITAAILVPWGLARVCGSGIAPAVAVMKVLVPAAAQLQLDEAKLGAIVAVAAHFGRTMSPAAAVVAICSTLSESDRSDVLQHVTPPLLAGLALLLVAAWCL